MKIQAKLTWRYLGVTAAVFSLFALAVYLFSEQTREREFFRGLKKEAVTKANLFLSGRADAATMQAIYRNNREFIDEVEVAVYTEDFELLYHDAQYIDVVKETPELIGEVIARKSIDFYQDRYQAVAMAYVYGGKEYVITAAAYDGYGYAQVRALTSLLLALWLCGLAVLAVVGYLMARAALAPVARIADEADAITESSLDRRLAVKNPGDELGELSETFNRLLDRLEKSFGDQKMFVSNVAHELRTPLAALIAELEITLLREERPAEEYRAVAANALEDARRLTRLVGGLLDLAKAGYDPSQVVMEELRLDELLMSARETILRANPEYRVELIFDQEGDDDRAVTVRGNEYLLKIAFSNLIENNCKFSGDRTSHVHISFYGPNAVLRFSDTGIGICKEDMDQLFTPFYRGANGARAKGQGIGMAVALKILTLHGGAIAVNSYPGEGTVFTVEIPHL